MEGLELINLVALLIWIHVSVMWNTLEKNVSKYKGIVCVCVCFIMCVCIDFLRIVDENEMVTWYACGINWYIEGVK
jgi:hypothetical protein